MEGVGIAVQCSCVSLLQVSDLYVGGYGTAPDNIGTGAWLRFSIVGESGGNPGWISMEWISKGLLGKPRTFGCGEERKRRESSILFAPNFAVNHTYCSDERTSVLMS